MPDCCTICNHKFRADIENALLEVDITAGPNEPGSMESIANQYNVSLEDLKMHAIFHTPLLRSSDIPNVAGVSTQTNTRSSLARKMQLREIDMLESVANEYLVSLKTLGRRINRLTSVSSIDEEDADKALALAKLLTKPVVDLYVGMGGEIRQTVKTMADIDRLLNGPEQDSNAGLKSLVEAIRGSGDTT